jgi:hypothetical protein
LNVSTIVCLDDLLRDGFWPAKEFMYDLIRLPLHFAAGIDIAKSPRNGQRSNMKPGFDHQHFVTLCEVPPGAHGWTARHAAIPPAAADYLAGFIPDGALVLGYEMPPWQRELLSERGLAWLDLRLSPLRFGADLYFAVRASDPALHARLFEFALTPQQVMLEAGLIAASIRHDRRYRNDNLRYDGAVIYIGQTGDDASLIDSDGQFFRCERHADVLRELAAQAPFFYRAHPYAEGFARDELRRLQAILGKAPQVCDESTYELLGADDQMHFVGISSGVLQEAEWFGKSTLMLHTPVCAPSFSAEDAGYAQIMPAVFMSEGFWAALLGRPIEGRAAAAPMARPNLLRELHNAWWGYSTYALRNSRFHQEAFALHGGAQHAQAIRQLAGANGAHAGEIERLRQEVADLKEALAVVLRHRPHPGVNLRRNAPLAS